MTVRGLLCELYRVSDNIPIYVVTEGGNQEPLDSVRSNYNFLTLYPDKDGSMTVKGLIEELKDSFEGATVVVMIDYEDYSEIQSVVVSGDKIILK